MTITESRIERSIAEAKERFSNDQLSVEDLEAEVEFWLRVERCPYCSASATGGSLCTSHYSELLGR